MASELVSALFKRRSEVESAAETWESQPVVSSADASHLSDIAFNGQATPSAQDWLRQLESTPEEDALTEALADGLVERGERLPLHVPAAITPQDNKRLHELTLALTELQEQFRKERDGLGEAREDIARREAELQERERALEAERELQRRREEARSNYPQPEWLENIEGTINISVVGNAGVGKSLLINKIRRVRPHSDGWAPVGIVEKTRRPTVYAFPGQPRVRLWDLPGAGTASVPSETYVQDMGLRYFDKVLIVTAGRFTSMEIALRAEMRQHSVPFFMVRTKVDIDVWNNTEDNALDELQTVAQIKEDFKENHSVDMPYLVSSRDPDSYDMPRLVADLFPGMKRQLDPEAPCFSPAYCSTAPAAWNEAWAMPPVFSTLLGGLQGRWADVYHAVYLVQSSTVHVSLQQGGRAIVNLTQSEGRIWWMSRWHVGEESVQKARIKGELRWTPVCIRDKPMIWWWSD